MQKLFFNTLKIAFNFELFFDITKNQYSFFKHLKVACKAEILRILLYFQDIIGSFSCSYIFCSVFNAVFKVEKMHSGSKFCAWVSFHTTFEVL